MSITINSTEIKITNDTYSFEDIYNYADQHNKTKYIKKLGTSYEIKNDLRIKSGSIEDSDVQVTVLGDLIQIHKGASLKLGNKRSDGSTYGSCYLGAPNIKLAYGFGHKTISSSGDLFIYNSIVNVFGFWSFFEGTNHVEIIDCQVNGFGRIAGSNSILKNIIFKQSHGKYGILSPSGDLRLMQNLSVFDATTEGSNRCSIYHNPEFAHDLTIIGGTYSGYDKLAYIEENSGGDKLIFIDSTILGNYDLERESDNVDMFVKYTFNPICRDGSGTRLSNVRIVCRDKNNDVVFDETSDQYGSINYKIPYYFSDKDGSNDEILTPHTMEITKDDISLTRVFQIDKPLKEFPLYITSESTGGSSSDCDGAAIIARINEAEDAIQARLTNLDSGLRQVLSNVVDEVNENQVIIQETGYTITI